MKTVSDLHATQKKTVRNPLVLVIGVVLAVCLILYGIFFSSAQIQIFLTNRPLTQTTDMKANINNSSIDGTKKSIPAYLESVNESSSSSLATTGSTDVGNDATGTITIYNQGSGNVIVPKGTTFITNDLNAFKYALQNDVSVPASQSQTGQLQATTAGAEYNIPANTAFVVGVPNVTATSTNAFTGGTSSNAQSVAQADQDNLKKSLTDQLYQKGKDDLGTKITSDMVAIKDSLAKEEVTKSFDSNVGDKASILNLSLTIKVSELIYKVSDIKKLENTILTSSLKTNESLNNLTVQSNLISYSKASGDIAIHAQATGEAIPVINKASLQSSLAGKSKGDAISFLTAMNGVKSVSISISPWWVGIFDHLPTQKNNLQFSISSK